MGGSGAQRVTERLLQGDHVSLSVSPHPITTCCRADTGGPITGFSCGRRPGTNVHQPQLCGPSHELEGAHPRLLIVTHPDLARGPQYEMLQPVPQIMRDDGNCSLASNIYPVVLPAVAKLAYSGAGARHTLTFLHSTFFISCSRGTKPQLIACTQSTLSLLPIRSSRRAKKTEGSPCLTALCRSRNGCSLRRRTTRRCVHLSPPAASLAPLC